MEGAEGRVGRQRRGYLSFRHAQSQSEGRDREPGISHHPGLGGGRSAVGIVHRLGQHGTEEAAIEGMGAKVEEGRPRTPGAEEARAHMPPLGRRWGVGDGLLFLDRSLQVSGGLLRRDEDEGVAGLHLAEGVAAAGPALHYQAGLRRQQRRRKRWGDLPPAGANDISLATEQVRCCEVGTGRELQKEEGVHRRGGGVSWQLGSW